MDDIIFAEANGNRTMVVQPFLPIGKQSTFQSAIISFRIEDYFGQRRDTQLGFRVVVYLGLLLWACVLGFRVW